MTHSYNNQMAASVNPRLENLLASLSLNLAEESQTALERASGLTGSATVALLALEEFLGDAHVGRLADVLGLTHSGAVRLVTQLEARAGGATHRRGPPTGRGAAHRRGPPAGRGGTGGPRRGRAARRPATSTQPRGPAWSGCWPSWSRRGSPRRIERRHGRGDRRLVVPHLRLRRLRTTRGPLPGPGDRRGGLLSP